MRRPRTLSLLTTTPASRRLLLYLLPLLLLTAFLLLTSPILSEPWHWPTDARIPHRFNRPPPYFPPPGHLAEWVAEEEERYKVAVADRWDLVRQYGPGVDDLQTFPKGKPYTLWDFFIPAWRCPHSTQRVGKLADGGKWVCGMELLEAADKCVIYSFGVSSDSSFEAEMLKRAPGCEVWGYDFSVNSWGPQITLNDDLSPRAHFHKWGLGGLDTLEPNKPPMYTLRTLMAMNKHTFIDVLKIDIEGSEFDALMSFIASLELNGEDAVPFGQMQIEVHVWKPRDGFRYFMEWWELLERFGLRPFWFEPNLVYVNSLHARPDAVEYAFINVKGNHALVAD
ncbi:unnamed protein product [Peniophora sp. CBMAI 1063]|nr:unnamed protein product [Peniophora sp. CBMAI 1063]